MSWFREYKHGDPVRLVANVDEMNLVHNILENIKGIGCRIDKPRGQNGRGWRIIVDGSTDLNPIPDSMIGTDTGQIPARPYDLQSSIGVPPGVIVMWSGTVASIPLTWALCDGSNGTPDLRKKFIYGANTTDNTPGTTGGAASHGHSLTASGSFPFSAIDHHHPDPETIDNNTPFAAGDVTMYTSAYTGGMVATTDTAISGDISVTVTGSSDSSSNVPPFYALAYIMKL